jgi:carboxyl-terminal processing protease
VEGRMLEEGYAYVRIRSFQERTARDLHRALDRLREENGGEFDGFVLDLRDNPGGLLDQAVKVADTWLDRGLIVYTQGRVATQQQEYKARPNGEGRYPLVVLVNAGSASASEIVAGALQDQHRALLVGGETFGKGSVQTVYPLADDSGLRLTTALYFTPSGRSIQEVGIEPDIEVQQQALAGGEQREDELHKFREQDLEGHFTQEEAVPESETTPEPDEGAAADVQNDVQLTRAVEVLKSWTYFDRLRKEGEESAPIRSAEAAGEAPAP